MNNARGLQEHSVSAQPKCRPATIHTVQKRMPGLFISEC